MSCPENIEEALLFGSTYYESVFLNITSYCVQNGVMVVQRPAPGTLLPVGVHLIELLITDEYDNIFNCSFELKITSTLGIDELLMNTNSIKLFLNPTNDKVTVLNKSKLK